MKSGFVAIIGRPNAGKSTLLNSILDRKIAIVSDKPQTTRNRITGILTQDEAQIVFLDTPGIHKPKHKLGQFMLDTAQVTLEEVDVIYYMVDATVSFGAGEQYILDKLAKVNTPVFLILNKTDRLKPEQILESIGQWQKRRAFQEVFPVSALKGENIASLIHQTIGYLPEGPKYYPDDAVTDQPEQVIITELIREKILHLTREEIPHSIAVILDIMEKRANETVYIGATIFVERDSQKGIIIGNKGEMLKKVGSAARGDIEFLLGNKVFLELWVKVKSDWRNKENILRNLGYQKF